jgi:hypothetical protein
MMDSAPLALMNFLKASQNIVGQVPPPSRSMILFSYIAVYFRKVLADSTPVPMIASSDLTGTNHT